MNTMHIEESLRNLFWNPEMRAALPDVVLSLALAAMLGVILGQVYIRFGQSLSNRRLFARNFLLLVVTTTLVISIVKSSLALSLGLVGALSIVRFRTPIKEPEELAYLFLAIGIGLGLGAGQALVTLVALIIILGLIVIRGLTRRPPPQGNLYLTVDAPASTGLNLQQLLQLFAETGAVAALKRYDLAADRLEAAFHVDFPTPQTLEQFTQKLRTLAPDARVTCVDDRALAI
ncbi:DUF4956 domain-containing protein [Limisphaera sp. 4302-co]|uniref:DUF4956 domain-containing protein n=1 Tax=Limisphaera sp. 4302-co TaxID=3400417 RepID=UPI003C2282C7